jgi:N-acetylmuramoyl-L-alanine amidase
MRSFGRVFVGSWLLVAIAAGAAAQSASPRALYEEALAKERAIRKEMAAVESPSSAASLLRRLRSLVASYEQMSRRFPSSGYMDNALWQGALLAADAFWSYGDSSDRAAAIELFSALRSRFPTSSLIRQSPPHVKRLTEASAPTGPAVSVAPGRERQQASSGAATLSAVRRDVLPDTLRVTLELAREVRFEVGQLDSPPRLYIDFDNTGTIHALRDATIPFDDDVVRRVRIGRQAAARTRVVFDLDGATRPSIYPLYNPYRLVVDFKRDTARPAVVPAVAVGGSSPDEPAPTPAVPPTVEAAASEVPPSPPAPPAVNGSGGFSLSRQLGLGVSRIVIDPGHGGHDPGAKTSGLTEADLVLDIAFRLERLLRAHEVFDVVLTRRTDTFLPLETRTEIANREGADLFLSIHANASANGAARGVETYFLNLTTNRDAEIVAARENAASARNMSQLPDIVKAIALNNKIDESRDFAAMVQRSLAGRLREMDAEVRDLGVKQAPFMVLLGATMPSVLTEVSFMTNRTDAALLRTEAHRQRIAEALHAGILEYQQSLKRAPIVADAEQ